MGLNALKSLSFALVATFLWAGTASAARPTTVANTTWVLQTNLDVTTLTITTQSGPGAPGAANCRGINGHFENVNVRSVDGIARRPGGFTSCIAISTAATRSGSSRETSPTR
jgi:hypothetical protein